MAAIIVFVLRVLYLFAFAYAIVPAAMMRSLFTLFRTYPSLNVRVHLVHYSADDVSLSEWNEVSG